jgi:peptide-methionine (S)-S-oxide reductase
MKIIIFCIAILNLNFMNVKYATFGSGCFWCTEAIFELVDGVIEVESGYSGGKIINPTYEEVSSGKTNFAEVTRIKYDANKVSFIKLLEVFWKTHDPTTLNRQGADVGTQYRSIIFYHDLEQKKLSETYLEKLDNSDAWLSPIVTKIEKLENYYKAENYHQDYFKINPTQAYCSYVISPKVEKFKKVFSDILKEQ